MPTEKEITREDFITILAIFREIDIKIKNLFTSAVQKVGNKWSSIATEHNEKKEDIDKLYCLKALDQSFLFYEVDIKDKDGKFVGIRVTDKLKFDIEGDKKRRKAIKELLSEKITVPVYPVPDCPQAKELSISARNLLAGIVLDIEPVNWDSEKIPAWALEDELKQKREEVKTGKQENENGK